MSAIILPFKRGRRPAVHTRRTMRLALAFHQALAALGTPPTSSDDYVSGVMRQSAAGWLCWWNNQLGDCVCEDSGHGLMLRTANAGSIIVPTAQDILELYEAVGRLPARELVDGSGMRRDQHVPVPYDHWPLRAEVSRNRALSIRRIWIT